MPFIYTRHAEQKILERKLSKKIIENAFYSPDTLIKEAEGVQIINKKLNGNIVRIVFRDSSEGYIIITAYFAKAERYGELHGNYL